MRKLNLVILSILILSIFLTCAGVSGAMEYLPYNADGDRYVSATDAQTLLTPANRIIPAENESSAAEKASDMLRDGLEETNEYSSQSVNETERRASAAFSETEAETTVLGYISDETTKAKEPTGAQSDETTQTLTATEREATKQIPATSAESTDEYRITVAVSENTTAAVTSVGDSSTQATTAYSGISEITNDFSEVNEPHIKESLSFDCSLNTVIGVMGTARYTYTENAGGKTITSYVYCNDYSELTVIQLCNGKMSGIMTFNTLLNVECDGNYIDKSSFSNSSLIDSLKSSGYSVTAYREKFNNNRIYAYYVSKGYNYSFSKLNGIAVQEQLSFHFTNAIRAVNGLTAFKYSSAASDAARLHSEDMAEHSFFSHTASNGSLPEERLAEQNIDYVCSGENICRNYSNAFESIDALYNSESHRITILAPILTHLGIGCAKSSAGFGYITQDFYSL